MDAELLRLLMGVGTVLVAVVVYWGRRRRASSVSQPRTPFTSPPGGGDASEPEHAVIVHLALSAPDFGSEADLGDVHTLEDALTEATETAGVGLCDGHEIGQGTCELFLYGRDADELLRVVAPIVRRSRLGKGAWAEKRYGPPGGPSVPTVRVDLDDVAS